MLGGRYSQWSITFSMFNAVVATEGVSRDQQHTTIDNSIDMTPENKEHFYNYYQAPKPQRSNVTSSSTRPTVSTRHKGKEIAKPITPQSESVSEEDSDPEQAQRDKDMQKNLALLAKYFKKLYINLPTTTFEFFKRQEQDEDTAPRYNIRSVKEVWESKDNDSCWE
ncbi:hypothetical protein Tco_0447924 [Tanacetum coccineum]